MISLMKPRFIHAATVFALFLAISSASADPKTIAVGPDDWPWWRGPTRNGVANPKQDPPLRWSATENVVWKVPVPGRGHGSPTVVGDHVYLATAELDNDTQSVLCYDRATGRRLW